MNNTDINSLKVLQKRKAEVKKELSIYENKLQDDYYKLTHPVETYLNSFPKNSNLSNLITLEKVSGVISSVQQIISFVKIGISIYKSSKKR